MRDVKRLKHLPMEKGGILSSSIVTFNSIPLNSSALLKIIAQPLMLQQGKESLEMH